MKGSEPTEGEMKGAVREVDTEWCEHRIASVGDGGSITMDDGWSFWIGEEHGVTPKVGDVVRMYGRGVGHPVRGLDLNGVSLYYRTAAEEHAKWEADVAAQKAEKRATWERNRDQMDRDLAALPLPFQMRVVRFRHNNPDFGWDYEPYEMASCVDAVKIAAAVGTPEALRTFHAAPWEAQKAAVPDLSDDHSGNTFGMAVRLAHHFLTNPDLVWMEHAAISPLVGCDCGCQPVKNEASERALYEQLAAQLPSPTNANLKPEGQ